MGSKYTGADNIYLAKGTFWLTSGQLLYMGASFLSAIAFANLLDPRTYGNYKYILSFIEISAVFTLTGMRTVIVQAVAQGFEGSFYTAFKTKLKWGVLGSVVAVAGAIYYWLRGNYILPLPLLFGAAFLPLMYASSVFGSFLAGRKLFNIQTRYNAILKIVSVGALITTLFLTKNIFWLSAVYFLSNAALNYFFYHLTKVKFKPNKKEDPKTLSFGKHLSLMGGISNIATYLENILIFTFLGSPQLAIYSFALIIPDQINTILKNIDVLAFPKLSVRSREEIKAKAKERIVKLFFLTAVIIVAYIIIAPYFYRIFFPQYLNSVLYSQLLILSLIGFPISFLSVVFHAKMKQKELYLLKIAAVVRIILLFILTPLYGILGVIAATIGTEIISSILTLFLFRKF